MKKIIITSLVTTLVIVIIGTVALEMIAQEEQQKGIVVKIDSKILGETRNILIHLPRYYESSNKHYPVLYATDGTSHDHLIADAATTLHAAGSVQEFITVGIPNTNRNRDLTPPFIKQNLDNDKPGEADKFLAFIQKEVVPYLNANYRTTDYKMLSGHSRGGLFSIYSLYQSPDLFDAYFAFSPALWRDETLIVDSLKSKLPNNGNQFLYMSLGTDENDKMRGAFDAGVSYFESISSDSSLHFRYQLTPEANHGTNSYYSIPKALSMWNEFFERAI